MTFRGLIKFDLDYVIERTTFSRKFLVMNCRQKAIEESPEIPMNEYRWYFCPLEVSTCQMQIGYYSHWMKYNENIKVSVEKISEIIKDWIYNRADKIYKLVIKYDLTKAAFIWDVLCNVYPEFGHPYELFKRLKEPPFNTVVPLDNRSTEERYQEVKRKGLTITRKEAEQRRKIREEMEEAYVKEG
jgi:hypothetical protein